MKNLKLKKLLTLMTITFVTAIAIFPIKASAAWKQSDNGNWSYTQGNTAVSGWSSIDGKWYFFDSNSIMKTGWINDGASWYYISPSGEMKTGWINDGGKWYYTASSGAMQTGWLSNNGAWYYLSTSGDMKTGLVETNGKTYYLSESGAMKTGNVTVNGVNYAFATNGEKLTSPPAKTTTTDLTPSVSDKVATSSGGSGGGGGGGASDSDTTTYPYYASLYGTWTVEKYIDSNIPSTLGDLVSFCIGKEFKIESSKLSSIYMTINNPKIKEGKMTSSQFFSKYHDTLENVGISGGKVKYIHLSNSSKSSSYVDVFITDNGTVYALLKGSLFELKKQ